MDGDADVARFLKHIYIGDNDFFKLFVNFAYKIINALMQHENASFTTFN